jgi:hypothetical protein
MEMAVLTRNRAVKGEGETFYFYSAYQNITSLRRLSPNSIALLNPEAAWPQGNPRNWVSTHTEGGSIHQKPAASGFA